MILWKSGTATLSSYETLSTFAFKAVHFDLCKNLFPMTLNLFVELLSRGNRHALFKCRYCLLQGSDTSFRKGEERCGNSSPLRRYDGHIQTNASEEASTSFYRQPQKEE